MTGPQAWRITMTVAHSLQLDLASFFGKLALSPVSNLPETWSKHGQDTDVACYICFSVLSKIVEEKIKKVVIFWSLRRETEGFCEKSKCQVHFHSFLLQIVMFLNIFEYELMARF